MIEPPEDLWPAIRRRIAARQRLRRTGAITGIAALAAVIVIFVTRATPVIRIAPVASATVRAVSDSADATNDAQVERELLDELELRRGELRPETEVAVRASLRTIDSAITELKTELARRPNDPALAQLLAEAYAHKVDLMKLLANAS